MHLPLLEVAGLEVEMERVELHEFGENERSCLVWRVVDVVAVNKITPMARCGVQVQVQIQTFVHVVKLVLQHFFDPIYLELHFWVRIIVIAIEILAAGVKSVVTSGDTIRVNHGHDDKYVICE